MLNIEKLNVSVGDKKILKDFNLKIAKVKFMPLWARMDLEKAPFHTY